MAVHSPSNALASSAEPSSPGEDPTEPGKQASNYHPWTPEVGAIAWALQTHSSSWQLLVGTLNPAQLAAESHFDLVLCWRLVLSTPVCRPTWSMQCLQGAINAGSLTW
jgi:hypothetical protein